MQKYSKKYFLDFTLSCRSLGVGWVLFFIFTNIFISTSLSQNLESLNEIYFSWQAVNSYVPPFYEGRPLPGEQSTIKLIATTNFSNSLKDLDKNNFFYEWYFNTLYSSPKSGIGKNILSFDLDQLENTNTVLLKIYSDENKNTLLAEKSIKIGPYDALALIYKPNNNPLIMYSQALNRKYQSYKMKSKENLDILVEPYYFSITNPEDINLNYQWKQNGVAGLPNTKNTFTLKAPEYQYGDLSLEIEISHAKLFLQNAKTLFSISLQ